MLKTLGKQTIKNGAKTPFFLNSTEYLALRANPVNKSGNKD